MKEESEYFLNVERKELKTQVYIQLKSHSQMRP